MQLFQTESFKIWRAFQQKYSMRSSTQFCTHSVCWIFPDKFQTHRINMHLKKTSQPFKLGFEKHSRYMLTSHRAKKTDQFWKSSHITGKQIRTGKTQKCSDWSPPISRYVSHDCARNNTGPVSQQTFHICGKTGNTAKVAAFKIALHTSSGTVAPSAGAFRWVRNTGCYTAFLVFQSPAGVCRQKEWIFHEIKFNSSFNRSLASSWSESLAQSQVWNSCLIQIYLHSLKSFENGGQLHWSKTFWRVEV